MTTEDKLPPTNALRRWSMRKHQAARPAPDVPLPSSVPAAAAQVPPADLAPPVATDPAPVPEASPLPSIESLSFESDFAAFLRPQVDETLKRQALKKLFSDSRFNVMDGLDIYIDDYTKADPISPELVRQLVQGRGIFGLHDEPRAPGDEGIDKGAVDGPLATASTTVTPAVIPAEAPAAVAPPAPDGTVPAAPTEPDSVKRS
jgi:hypothetical protein